MSELGISVCRTSEVDFVLELEGAVPTGWIGNLSMGLAEAGISIRSGAARSDSLGRWLARLELCRTPGGKDPASLDLEELASRPSGAGFATRIEILEYSLARDLERAALLRLDVCGRDRLGFLAALLRRLAFFALFPVELELETEAGRAIDRLWLQSGGSAPSERVRRALDGHLRALARPTRPRPGPPSRP
jgi:hypothetical protein